MEKEGTRKRKGSSSTILGDLKGTVVFGGQSVVFGEKATVTNVFNINPDSDPSIPPSQPPSERRKRRRQKNSSNRRQNLESRFNSIEDSEKWLLPTGRSVENVMFEESLKLDEHALKGSLYPSFILLVDSTNPKPSIFTPAEWKAILDASTELPKRRPTLLQAYRTVQKSCEMQKAVDKDVIELAFITDSKEEEEVMLRRWVRSCYEHYLFLNRFRRLSEPKSEGWLNVNVWSTFLDKCVLSLAELDLDRGETCCQATAERRNRERCNYTERQRIGRRLDGIFTLREMGLELGGIECSKFHIGGAKSTKWLKDSQKLAMAMRDMMVVLQGHYPTIRRKIRIVGVICRGLTLRPYVMENPCGQICLFRAMEPVHIPTNFNPRVLATTIVEVAKIRDILAKSIQDLSNCASEALLDQLEEVKECKKHKTLLYSADTDGADGKYD